MQLQAAQILQGQMQSVGQSGATSQAPVTLVKSVAAPAGASGVPIPVSINVTMGQGQQKTGLRESLLTTLSGQHTHLVTTVGNALSGHHIVTTVDTTLSGHHTHLVTTVGTALSGHHTRLVTTVDTMSGHHTQSLQWILLCQDTTLT